MRERGKYWKASGVGAGVANTPVPFRSLRKNGVSHPPAQYRRKYIVNIFYVNKLFSYSQTAAQRENQSSK